MDLREAMLRAADSIEAHPNLFDYQSIDVPDEDCGTGGCALGWIAYHIGAGVLEEGCTARCWAIDQTFMQAFPSAAESDFADLTAFLKSDEWQRDPLQCAAGLRAFAASI